MFFLLSSYILLLLLNCLFFAIVSDKALVLFLLIEWILCTLTILNFDHHVFLFSMNPHKQNHTKQNIYFIPKLCQEYKVKTRHISTHSLIWGRQTASLTMLKCDNILMRKLWTQCSEEAKKGSHWSVLKICFFVLKLHFNLAQIPHPIWMVSFVSISVRF